MSYAILKYQLMEIRIFIRRAALFYWLFMDFSFIDDSDIDYSS